MKLIYGKLLQVNNMRCECSIAGYCTRHAVHKSTEWVALCQSRSDYFRIWEEGRGPGQPVDPVKVKQLINSQERRINLFHELWLAIHTKQNPTPAWFEAWCSLVPNFGCGCEAWLRNYIAVNPPMYNDWFAYSVELHNAVNAKITTDDKPREQWTIKEAAARWSGSFTKLE